MWIFLSFHTLVDYGLEEKILDKLARMLKAEIARRRLYNTDICSQPEVSASVLSAARKILDVDNC